MNILEKILKNKRLEIDAAKKQASLAELQGAASRAPKPLPFVAALRESYPSVIAEVKRASPSKGIIREELNPVATALGYAKAGAACISVLTDSAFFGGELSYLQTIRTALSKHGLQTPLLRKDFIIDEYQLLESRAHAADAVLLIVAALDRQTLKSLHAKALELELDVIVEVHNADELQDFIELQNISSGQFSDTTLLGINNRDLTDFSVSLQTSVDLIARYRSLCKNSSQLIISESGIHRAADMHLLGNAGADGFLIGESLVRSGEPEENLRTLLSEYRKGA